MNDTDRDILIRALDILIDTKGDKARAAFYALFAVLACPSCGTLDRCDNAHDQVAEVSSSGQ